MSELSKNLENYFAIVFKEKTADKEYDVIFPDFDGCVTTGEDMEEIRKNAHNVLEFHIEGMVEDHEEIPLPSKHVDMSKHMQNGEIEFFLLSVEVKIPEANAKRINITIPEYNLNKIDRYIKEHHISSRSAFLLDSAMANMG